MEVFHGELGEWSAELRKCFIDCKSVDWTGLDKDVQIFGHAWLSVNEDRVATHDDVFNAVPVQCEQQLF
jgi:hypothetical protein